MKANELKQKMVNVHNDLWYDIVDYATDVEGNVVEVKADNGTWHDISKVS